MKFSSMIYWYFGRWYVSNTSDINN